MTTRGEWKVFGNVIDPKNINAGRITCQELNGVVSYASTSQEVQAGESITQGQVVSINPVTGKAVPGFGFPIPSQISLSDITILSNCSLTPTTVIAAYQGATSTLGRARVGTVNPDNTITYSNAFLFSGANSVANSISVQRVTDTTFLIAYRDATQNRGKLIIGQVSGTGASATIAYQAAPTDFNGALNAGAVIDSIRLIPMSPNVFILVFRDTGNSNRGSWLVITVVGVGVTATFQINAKTQFNGTNPVANNTNSLTAAPINATQFIVGFNNNGTTLTALIGTISGTGVAATIAAGPPINIDTTHVASAIYIASRVLSATKAVIAFQQNLAPTVSTDGLICVLTISGNTLTAGPSTAFVRTFSDGMQWPSIRATSSTSFAIIYRNIGQNLVLEIATGHVSGSDVIMDQQNVQLAPNAFWTKLTNLTDTKLYMSYIEVAFLSQGESLIVDIVDPTGSNTVDIHETTGQNPIGIAANDAEAGQEVTVVFSGAVSIPQLDLRPGYIYFARADGTISIANDVILPQSTPFAIGIGLTEHQLLVTNLFESL